jgi:hypothetical protein
MKSDSTVFGPEATSQRASVGSTNGTSLSVKSKPICICGLFAGTFKTTYRYSDYFRLVKNPAIPATSIKPAINMLSHIRSTHLTQVL